MMRHRHERLGESDCELKRGAAVFVRREGGDTVHLLHRSLGGPTVSDYGDDDRTYLLLLDQPVMLKAGVVQVHLLWTHKPKTAGGGDDVRIDLYWDRVTAGTRRPAHGDDDARQERHGAVGDGSRFRFLHTEHYLPWKTKKLTVPSSCYHHHTLLHYGYGTPHAVGRKTHQNSA